MNRGDMLIFLHECFDTWEEVRDFMIGLCQLNGWYAFWEGEEVSDFSFCSQDPRGDNTGEHITEKDFI